ncbi:MAG: hypothetical protein ACTHW2_07075 [Tissierella sp.]|uniref:hypothetical protein n=1 Tax=Tissierella sp. TaxID=41274 RepID=UPI003F9B8032
MKKIISLLLVLMLLMSVVVGCTQEPADEDADAPETEAPEDNDEEDEEDEESEGEANITKVGLGNMVSISKSASAEDDKPAKSQADITVAAVGFDDDGMVQSVTIDVSQPKVEFDEDMKIASDIEEEVKSKHELKEDYDMKKASPIEKEWYEQMNSFQEWMVGKTVEEITGMKTKEANEANEDHPTVPDVEELTSSVTIDVGTYLAAVQDAWDNAKDVEGAEKVGLGFKTTLDSSKGAEDDKNAVAQSDATMTATAFDADGEILKSIVDTVQVKVEFDEDGNLVTEKDAEFKTKHELKEDYDMKKASPIEKEWYEQMNSFQEWMEDQSVEEVTGMKTKEANEDHPTVPDVEELTSTVTMDVGGYLEVIQEAWDNAK